MFKTISATRTTAMNATKMPTDVTLYVVGWTSERPTVEEEEEEEAVQLNRYSDCAFDPFVERSINAENRRQQLAHPVRHAPKQQQQLQTPFLRFRFIINDHFKYSTCTCVSFDHNTPGRERTERAYRTCFFNEDKKVPLACACDPLG